MKVQFNGPEAETTAFGATFPIGEMVDISDLSPAFQAKLAANPTFSAEDGDAAELDDLRAELTERSIKFHHKAGVEKLRALLAEANG